MRRHELRTARGYFEALIQANLDCRWFIEGIVTPKISEDGRTAHYEKEEGKYSHRFTSDNGGMCWDPVNFPHCFGWQETSFEDCHYGQMLFPLDGKEYLLIGFDC